MGYEESIQDTTALHICEQGLDDLRNLTPEQQLKKIGKVINIIKEVQPNVIRRANMPKEKPISIINSVGRIIITVGTIIGLLLAIGKWIGVFEQVEASIPAVKAEVKELGKRTGKLETDVAVLKEVVPRVENKLDDFRMEQRKHNSIVIDELRRER